MINLSFIRLLRNDLVEGWSRNFDYAQYCEFAHKWTDANPASQEDYELACNILENGAGSRGSSESIKFLEKARDQFITKVTLESRVQELEKTVCLLRNAISVLQQPVQTFGPQFPNDHWRITCGTP